MAGRELNSTLKAKGSTILEVIISMIVILIVFTIAMMIYANVNKLSLSAQKVKAEAILKERLLLIEQTGQSDNLTGMADDFLIEQNISLYQENKHLSEVHLTAYD